MNAHIVSEYELDTLASGSLWLAFALALLPFSGALLIAIFGTEIPSDRVYFWFVSSAVVTGVAGLTCLTVGVVGYKSNRALAAAIKRRTPPEGDPPTAPAAGPARA